MQLFIDSAKPEQISEIWDLGILDGVTTNPTLAAETGREYMDIVEDILEIIDHNSPLSLEVIATDYAGMVRQARILSDLDRRIVVKLPCTKEGIKATKHLHQEGILVNMTLVFSPMQALLAAKAGAHFVSPFVGRINDIEEGAGDEVIEDIVEIFDNYGYSSAVLYSSVRDLNHVKHAALIGADIATVPYEVLLQMTEHKLTSIGLEKFLSDWKESGLKLPA